MFGQTVLILGAVLATGRFLPLSRLDLTPESRRDRGNLVSRVVGIEGAFPSSRPLAGRGRVRGRASRPTVETARLSVGIRSNLKGCAWLNRCGQSPRPLTRPLPAKRRGEEKQAPISNDALGLAPDPDPPLDLGLSCDKNDKSSVVIEKARALGPNVVERRSPEETRARILEVAWDLFRQLGARTTIADVADRLGMSSANVYRFYPSKQALCEAVAASQLGAIIAGGARDRRAAPARPPSASRAMLLMLYQAMRDQMVNQVARARNRRHRDRASTGRRSRPSSRIAARSSPSSSPRGRRAANSGRAIRMCSAAQTLCACACIHHPHADRAITTIRRRRVPPEAVVDFALRALANPARSRRIPGA